MSIELFQQKKPVIIAGPCSAETEEQLLHTCIQLAKTGKVDVLRTGLWKPRTRPNSFEGIGLIGMNWLKRAKKETNLPIAVEVANSNHVEESLKNEVDIVWIGARTTVNPFSVQEIADALAGTAMTVLVKNPIYPDIELWIGALERLTKAGITKLGMVHRGFSQHRKSIYRNEPKWELAVDMKRNFPKIPLICDPSHISGNRELLHSISQQAFDMDFDGLMIESHYNPDEALSDRAQQITPHQLDKLLGDLVVRRSSILDEELTHKLSLLRNQIDLIDDDLLKLLGERMKIAEEIGMVKKEKGITILQTKRWEEIIDKVTINGLLQGLSNKFITHYLNALHQESIDHQNEVMNKSQSIESKID